MIEKIQDLLKRVEEFAPTTAAEVEEFRIKILGKKGELNALMEEFKTVPAEQKRELGQKINALKQAAQERVNTLKASLADSAAQKVAAVGDMTRPGSATADGTRHPISIVKNQIVEIFSRLGYTVAEGPEIEDDWHVFSALNFPLSHPARDMQDTFFVEKASNEPNVKDLLLRTHTSSIQVRAMERQQPPTKLNRITGAQQGGRPNSRPAIHADAFPGRRQRGEFASTPLSSIKGNRVGITTDPHTARPRLMPVDTACGYNSSTTAAPSSTTAVIPPLRRMVRTNMAPPPRLGICRTMCGYVGMLRMAGAYIGGE